MRRFRIRNNTETPSQTISRPIIFLYYCLSFPATPKLLAKLFSPNQPTDVLSLIPSQSSEPYRVVIASNPHTRLGKPILTSQPRIDEALVHNIIIV